MYAAEVNFNDVGRFVSAQSLLKEAKKYVPAEVILEVSNDHSGKLVSAQLWLNTPKNQLFTVFNHVDSLNDHSGKLSNAHWLLKSQKKAVPTEVMLEISNDHSGKLVSNQALLKKLKNWGHAVVILLVSNDHSGKLVIAQ